MCVKIIANSNVKELSISKPIEEQIAGAQEILVSYDPIDPKINFFVGEMERLCKNGVSCKLDIKINSNNYVGGMKLQKTLNKIKKNLEINELVKDISKLHSETDKKLSEISQICIGVND
jgi:hypothetical protein